MTVINGVRDLDDMSRRLDAQLEQVSPRPAVAGSAGPVEILAELVAQATAAIRKEPKLLTRAVKKRRAAAIHGYIGSNGNFKTWAMVRDTLPSLVLGRRVLSTVTILDPESGNPHPLFVPFTSWSQLGSIEHHDILLDEITGIMDSREQGMPRPVRRLMPQMRRNDNRVAWTGIDWDNSDRRLRQLSLAVTKCRGHFANWRQVRAEQRANPEVSRLWAPNRLAWLTTYDSSSLMQSEDSKQLNWELGGRSDIRARRAKVLVREAVWAPRNITFRCYNTLDAVSSVDSLCVHGLELPKPGLCKNPECYALHMRGLGHDVDGPL